MLFISLDVCFGVSIGFDSKIGSSGSSGGSSSSSSGTNSNGSASENSFVSGDGSKPLLSLGMLPAGVP